MAPVPSRASHSGDDEHDDDEKDIADEAVGWRVVWSVQYVWVASTLIRTALVRHAPGRRAAGVSAGEW